MSGQNRKNFKTGESAKKYQPEFPLVYNQRYGPYSSITSKPESLGKNFINLLMTNQGEWPMNPDLGIGIRTYLFSQSSSDILQTLRPRIVNQLNKYLPHIQLHSVEIQQDDEDIDGNRIKIKINCIIMNTSYASFVAYLDKLAKLIIDYKKVKELSSANPSLAPRLDSDLFSRVVSL